MYITASIVIQERNNIFMQAQMRFVYVTCVFSVIKAYQVLCQGLTQENNSVKRVGGVTVPSLCSSSDDALCLYHDKNLQRDKLYRNVGGVTVLDLCKLSGDALYLYKVS